MTINPNQYLASQIRKAIASLGQALTDVPTRGLIPMDEIDKISESIQKAQAICTHADQLLTDLFAEQMQMKERIG